MKHAMGIRGYEKGGQVYDGGPVYANKGDYYDIRRKENTIRQIEKEFESTMGRRGTEFPARMDTKTENQGIRAVTFQAGEGVHLNRTGMDFDGWGTRNRGQGLAGGDYSRLVHDSNFFKGLQAGGPIYASRGEDSSNAPGIRRARSIGIDFAFNGKRIDRENLVNKLAVKDPISGHERFPGLPQLLVDPFIEISQDYNAPVEAFNNLRTADEHERPDSPMGLLIPTRALRIQHDDSNKDYNLLQFNSQYRKWLANWQEYLADKGVHELGHLLSFSKTFDFSNPLLMPNVPLESIRDKHLGMQQGFSEFVRNKYSTSRNLFQSNVTQKPKIITDLSDLPDNLEGMSLVDALTTKDDNIAMMKAPSILYHADREGHFEYLMDHYNKLVRAINVPQRSKETEEYIEHLGNVINQTFLRKQSGGKIPGYGGGDKIPALLEAGEYVINKQAATKYHSVLDGINSDRIGRYAGGGPVYAQKGGYYYFLKFIGNIP